MKFNCTKVIAENLSEEEIKGLKQMFNNMDTDRSGTITYEELNSGLSRLGSKLTEVEIKQLMDGVRTMPLFRFGSSARAITFIFSLSIPLISLSMLS